MVNVKNRSSPEVPEASVKYICGWLVVPAVAPLLCFGHCVPFSAAMYCMVSAGPEACALSVFGLCLLLAVLSHVALTLGAYAYCFI